ncbi:hypothetical protein ACJIZ3_010959 [Penstemon smallii]|uniref:Uncharacterized protein n=1 Tax=Penstemon smallii TaxID=265156 RepID=A0ABD3UHX9_9LAMI
MLPKIVLIGPSVRFTCYSSIVIFGNIMNNLDIVDEDKSSVDATLNMPPFSKESLRNFFQGHTY